MHKILLISAFCYLVVAPYSTAEHLRRHRRGASVYATFPSGSGSGQSHSPYSESNPQAFIQYLGGTSGLYGSSSSSSNSGGGGGDNYFDSSNLANRYQYSGFADGDEGSVRNTRSSSSSSSSGWEPSASSVNYGGSPSFSPYFGAVTPNFANSEGSGSGSSSSCPGCPGSNTQPNPVSATGLLHSATSSFNAQTAVFNALTAGSSYTPYKGGRY